jgi:tetratricopeptide (TPR) repeat protein
MAPSVSLEQAIDDDQLLHQQQQEERTSIPLPAPTPAPKHQSPDDNDFSSFCYGGHATNSSSDSLQACVPVLTMTPASSFNSMEEYTEDDEHEYHEEEDEQELFPVLTMTPASSFNSMEEHTEDDQHEYYEEQEKEQDEQELFPSLLRSESFDLQEGPVCSTQQAPFSNDSKVSSLVSASFTCTSRVVDVYQTHQTHPNSLEEDPPVCAVLPFRKCNYARCHCRLWTGPSLEPEPSLSISTTRRSTPVYNNSLYGARTRVRARSEEYTSSLATSSPNDAYASSSSSMTITSPPSTTRKPMNPLPPSRKHQRQRSEDVVDIINSSTSSSLCPPLDLPPSCRHIKSQSEGCSTVRGGMIPKQQPSEPPGWHPLSKSQCERKGVLRPNLELCSRSKDFVDGPVPCQPNPIESSNKGENSLPPNQERIIQSASYSRDRANSAATSSASSNSNSSRSSVYRDRQLALKKYSSESNLSVPSRHLRRRSEDLVDDSNHSHYQLQARHSKNTQAATTVPTASPKRSQRSKTPASPTSVMDLSSAAASLASMESPQHKYKLPSMPHRKATLDELLQDAFRFESQGNLLVALEAYRVSLDVSKRRHQRTTCNQLIRARIYHRMGLLHYQMGDYHPSRRVLEQGLEVISISYGCLDLEETISVISDMHDVSELVTEISFAVARVHLSLGSIRHAKHAAKQGLEIVRNKSTSQVLFHKGLVVLAMIYELEGHWETALSHYQQALSFQQCHHLHHLGDHHHHASFAATISCIGNIYTKQGWLGPAMECFRESIRIYSLSKNSTLDIGMTLASIGWVQWWCGDLDSAIKSTTNALYIVRAGLVDGHRNTCTIQYQLGLIQARQGHVRTALKTLTLVLKAQRLSLGDDHGDVAITCDAIGDLYYHQQRSKKAASFFSHALDIRKRMLDKADLLLATSYSRLGLALGNIGNHSESQVCLAKTLAIYQANRLSLSDRRVQQALGRLTPPSYEPVGHDVSNS